MPAPPDPVYTPQKNTIIQWQTPEIKVTKKYKHLGVINADPDEYRKMYSASLLKANEIPDFAAQIQLPDGIELASNVARSSSYDDDFIELEGDLHALKLIDLDKEGLGYYKKYLDMPTPQDYHKSPTVVMNKNVSSINIEKSKSLSNHVVFENTSPSLSQQSEHIKVEFVNLLREVFNEIDKVKRGSIELSDAMEAILQINARLKRSYNENDMKEFFGRMDFTNRGSLTFDDFKKAFETIFF